MSLVRNLFPIYNHATARLAIIGEAPGREEAEQGRPFVGYSGLLLRRQLSYHNITLEHCFVGNVCQTRPPGNDISAFGWDGEEIQGGLLTLREDLLRYRPNAILALGATALRALCPLLDTTTVEEDSEDGRWSMKSYRGSILTASDPTLTGFKVVPSYHPAYCLRLYNTVPLLRLDCGRAVQEAAYPDLRLPQREIIIRPTFEQAASFLRSLIDQQTPSAFDVEGWNDHIGITMISFATSPTKCLVIPFFIDGQHYWPADQEAYLWRLIAIYLESDAPKSVTNAAYEGFILSWRHNIALNNIQHDSMVGQWEFAPEWPRSLAFQTSIWTREPYYKDQIDAPTSDGKLLYNGKDSCCTAEVTPAIVAQLEKHPPRYAHYTFNINVLPAIRYIQLRGCRFDSERALAHIEDTNKKLAVLQPQIDDLLVEPAGQAGVLRRQKGEKKDDPRHFNVKSNDQKCWLLYDYLKYKPYARLGQSASEEAILRYYAKHREPVLKLIHKAVSLRTRISDIKKLLCDPDGRIRSTFDLVGPNTGRLASKASNAMIPVFTKTGKLKWENTGTNLQNVTSELRDCFIPDDPGVMAFFQCDLQGADAWTVAADLAALGEPTMLEDLKFGIKPAKVLLLMLQEHEAGRDPKAINRLDRPTLKRLTKALTFPDTRDEYDRPGNWRYICAKRCQHGTNYDMGSELLSETIFKDSEGVIDLTIGEAGVYQYLYKLRYNTAIRRNYIVRQLGENGYLDTAGGTRRRFYNIRDSRNLDAEVVRQALSFEPQLNTTYACNKALLNLWMDPRNRTSRGTLHIEPSLLIHDAVAGQFVRANAPWAVERLTSYFQNEIKIHGIPLIIPFEGGYGHDWRNCHEVEF